MSNIIKFPQSREDGWGTKTLSFHLYANDKGEASFTEVCGRDDLLTEEAILDAAMDCLWAALGDKRVAIVVVDEDNMKVMSDETTRELKLWAWNSAIDSLKAAHKKEFG